MSGSSSPGVAKVSDKGGVIDERAGSSPRELPRRLHRQRTETDPPDDHTSGQLSTDARREASVGHEAEEAEQQTYSSGYSGENLPSSGSRSQQRHQDGRQSSRAPSPAAILLPPPFSSTATQPFLPSQYGYPYHQSASVGGGGLFSGPDMLLPPIEVNADHFGQHPVDGLGDYRYSGAQRQHLHYATQQLGYHHSSLYNPTGGGYNNAPNTTTPSFLDPFHYTQTSVDENHKTSMTAPTFGLSTSFLAEEAARALAAGEGSDKKEGSIDELQRKLHFYQVMLW